MVRTRSPVVLHSAVAVDGNLDAAAAAVERVARQADHMKGSITATASGSSSVVAVLKP